MERSSLVVEDLLGDTNNVLQTQQPTLVPVGFRV